MSVRRVVGAPLMGALVVLLATACGGGGSATTSDSGQDLEQTEITVGTMPIIDTAPFQIALQKGFFEEEGLTVKPQTIQGGAEAVPKLQSGALDISFGNYVSFTLAHAQGLKVHIASGGYVASENVFLILAMPDSGVRTVEDLKGKTIAVNTKSNVATLLTKSTLEAHDIDTKSVTFSEVPFPDMPAALESGSVDAAFPVEPFTSVSKMDLGAHEVVDVASGPTADWPIGGYASTEKFAEENPKTVAAFKRAMQRAQKVASERSKVEEILPTYTKIEAETVAVMAIGEYPTTVSETRLQRVADLMWEFKLLDNKVDVSTMVK